MKALILFLLVLGIAFAMPAHYRPWFATGIVIVTFVYVGAQLIAAWVTGMEDQ